MTSVLPNYPGTGLLPEKTISYRSYLKTQLVLSLQDVYTNHPDPRIQASKITIEYPTNQNAYPTIVIRFWERSIRNAGVGHIEYIINGEGNTAPYRHYLYDGTIEYAIFALTSLDRDLMADALVQTLTMPDTEAYTEPFFDKIYVAQAGDVLGQLNYINLNTDKIEGFGDTQTAQPWLSEDQFVYQTSYRVGVYGEFYSLPPDVTSNVGVIESVELLPYLQGTTPPAGSNVNPDWQPPS